MLLFPAAVGCRLDDGGLAAPLGREASTIHERVQDARSDDERGAAQHDGGLPPADSAAEASLGEEGDVHDPSEGGFEIDATAEAGGPDADGLTSDSGDAAAPAAQELKRGLVLWLPFEGPVGAVTVRDDSGQGNRAALRDVDPALAWVPGHIGGALDLGAAVAGGGHLRVESSPSINRIGSELSIAVWLWRTSGLPGVIVSRRATAARGTLYRLSIDQDHRLRLLLNDRRGLRLDLRSSVALPTGRWVHAAITCDRTSARLYVDGQPSGSARYGVPLAPDVSPLLVGASESAEAPGGFLPERLDELLIHQRALSQAEVTALASGNRPPGPVD